MTTLALYRGRQSAEPGCHGTELLEPREAPFDHVPAPADHLVKNRRPTALASSASAIGLGGRAPRFSGRDADRVWYRGEHRAVRATVESTDAVHSTTPLRVVAVLGGHAMAYPYAGATAPHSQPGGDPFRDAQHHRVAEAAALSATMPRPLSLLTPPQDQI